jgi:hypothetical protein
MRSPHPPCLPTPSKIVPNRDLWFELKYDGDRLIVVRDDNRVRLFTRDAQRLDQPVPVDRRGRVQDPPQAICDRREAVILGVDAGHDRTGNMPSMPGIFPDYPAPIVRNGEAGRELVMARWRMSSSQKALMDATEQRAEKLQAKG